MPCPTTQSYACFSGMLDPYQVNGERQELKTRKMHIKSYTPVSPFRIFSEPLSTPPKDRLRTPYSLNLQRTVFLTISYLVRFLTANTPGHGNLKGDHASPSNRRQVQANQMWSMHVCYIVGYASYWRSHCSRHTLSAESVIYAIVIIRCTNIAQGSRLD